MTKLEFIEALSSRLQALTDEEREEVLSYWEENISDRMEEGISEEEAVAQLGDPEEIIRRILDELEVPDGAEKTYTFEMPDLSAVEQKVNEAAKELGSVMRRAAETVDSKLRSYTQPEQSEQQKISFEMPDLSKLGQIVSETIEGMGSAVQTVVNTVVDSTGKRSSASGNPKIQTYAVEGTAVTLIEVIDHNNGIDIEPADGETITLEWYEDDRHKYDLTVEDGVLRLEHQPPRRHWERLFGDGKRCRVKVRIPHSFTGGVDCQTSNSAVSARDLQIGRYLKLTDANASMEIRNVVVPSLQVKTSNARITAQALICDNVTLKTSNASLSLADAKAMKFDLTSSNGAVQLKQVQTPELRATTSNASILVEELNVRSATLHTSNGTIRGSLCGSSSEYHFAVSTSNGSVKIPGQIHTGDTSGLRHITASTSNGSVRFDCIQD